MQLKTKSADRREKLRKEYWPSEIAWDGKGKGWYPAPRTLPLILALLASKDLSGNQDPSRVYVELLARHMDEGFIEMTHEEDHAYAAGYWGPRGTRTWRERMEILQANGFIKVKPKGNRRYGFVLLVHPSLVIEQLRQKNKLPEGWWDTYRARQIETKETAYEDLIASREMSVRTLKLKKKTA